MATRMQQRRGTAAQWTSTNAGAGPVLNAGEIGWESDTNKFKIGDGVNNWSNLDYFADINSTINPSFGTSIVFEGATADSYETTIQVTDPSADRTITFPDATGTVALTSDIAELSQDAIDAAIVGGTGITKSYNDGANTLTISVDTSTIQARVADVSDTEIGYLNGVTSAIQTQLDDKSTASKTETLTNKTINAASNTITVTSANVSDFNEAAQDAIGTILGTGLSYNDAGPGIGINNAALTDYLLDGVSGSSYGLIGTSQYLDIKTGNGYNKEIELDITAVKTQLNTDGYLTTSSTSTLTNKTLTSPVVSGLTLSDSSIVIEGSTADAFETTLTITDPTADRTITFPDQSGTVALTSYVDAATAGLNVHASVQAATTANITLASAVENGDTLDGVTLATGNRILVKNQTDKTENGIYVVAASGAPARADDYNSTPEVDAGDFIYVEAGTANGKTGWVQTNVITTIESDNIEFTQFSGAGTYTAGTGLTLTGNVFSANIGTDIQAYNSTLAAVAGGTYTGDDSITTLGTITSGTWTGTTIAIANGGTGATTASSAAAALLPDQSSNSGKYLTTDGSGTLSWGTVSGYSAPTLGSTSIASGATVTTIAGLTLSNAALSGSLTAGGGTGTAGQVLQSTGSGVQWATSGGGAAFSEFMLIGA